MFKRIIGWLGWLVLGLCIIVLSFVLVTSRNGWQFAAVLSGSMEPTFHVGGLVIVKPVDAQKLEIGDAISFNLPGINTPICHRIIEIQTKDGQEYFQTKGDANHTPDQDLSPASSVNGIVVLHVPYLGRLIDAKDLGTTRISLLGKQLPAATMLVLVMGMLFIGLIFKDNLEDIFWPSKKLRREMVKKQNARLLKRRLAYKIR